MPRCTQSSYEKTGVIEVLSIDDDPVNQMVVEQMLEPHGYVVVVAMDAFQALDLLRTRDHLPDVILLDMMMPKMGGYELAENLRAFYPEASLPIIMVSAKSNEDSIVKGLKAGCNDYVTKPVRKRRLIASIETQVKFSKERGTNSRKASFGAGVPQAMSLQDMLPQKVVKNVSLTGHKIVEDATANVAVLYCLRQASKAIDAAKDKQEKAEDRVEQLERRLLIAEAPVPPSPTSSETGSESFVPPSPLSSVGSSSPRRVSFQATPESPVSSSSMGTSSPSHRESFQATLRRTSSTGDDLKSKRSSPTHRVSRQPQDCISPKGQRKQRQKPCSPTSSTTLALAASSAPHHTWNFSADTIMTAGKWNFPDADHADAGRSSLEAGGSYSLAALKPTIPINCKGCVGLEVEVTPPHWGNITISVCQFKGEEEVVKGNYNYWLGICSDGDIFGARGVSTSDPLRPQWKEGDRVRLAYDGDNRTVSYWHNGTLVLTAGGFKDVEAKMADTDQLCFCFDSDGREAKFQIV